MALAAIDAQRCRTIFNDFPQKSLGPVSWPARRVSMNMDSHNHGDDTAGPLNLRNNKLPCGRFELMNRPGFPRHSLGSVGLLQSHLWQYKCRRDDARRKRRRSNPRRRLTFICSVTALPGLMSGFFSPLPCGPSARPETEQLVR